MQPAFFLFMVISVSVMVDCTPRLWDPERLLQHQQSSFSSDQHGDLSAGTRRFYLEQSGSRRKVIQRPFLVILPVRTETSNFVSIFDLKRKRFLCMDREGELYHSRQRDREECLFQRIWLDFENPREVFYSTSGDRLLKLEAAELPVSHHEPPEPPLSLMQRFLSKRQKRSEDVNPSDPLRSESHPSHSAKDPRQDTEHRQQPPEQEQTGSVSKETITSCDDPLRVLQPNVPISPVKTNIAEQAEHD